MVRWAGTGRSDLDQSGLGHHYAGCDTHHGESAARTLPRPQDRKALHCSRYRFLQTESHVHLLVGFGVHVLVPSNGYGPAVAVWVLLHVPAVCADVTCLHVSAFGQEMDHHTRELRCHPCSHRSDLQHCVLRESGYVADVLCRVCLHVRVHLHVRIERAKRGSIVDHDTVSWICCVAIPSCTNRTRQEHLASGSSRSALDSAHSLWSVSSVRRTCLPQGRKTNGRPIIVTPPSIPITQVTLKVPSLIELGQASSPSDGGKA